MRNKILLDIFLTVSLIFYFFNIRYLMYICVIIYATYYIYELCRRRTIIIRLDIYKTLILCTEIIIWGNMLLLLLNKIDTRTSIVLIMLLVMKHFLSYKQSLTNENSRLFEK